MAITTVTDATAITVGIEATATATAGMALTAITVAGVDGCIATAVATGSSYWWSR